MNSVWITGAHGFIGGHLARHLQRCGFRVAGVGHRSAAPLDGTVLGISPWLNGDLTRNNLELLERTADTPTTIFHLAGGASVARALAYPYDDFNRSVLSTAELLEWARLHAPETCIVAVSSAAVYGAGHSEAISEDAALHPISPYAYHKLMMENLCRSYAANFGLRVVLPRLFSVYGPGLQKQLLWDICQKLATRGVVELGGTGTEVRDWTSVHDVVRNLAEVAELATSDAPVVNLATGVATSVKEIANIVIQRWEGAEPSSRVVFNGAQRPGDPVSLVADITRMRGYGLGYSIQPMQGIAEYVDWYRQDFGQPGRHQR